MIINNNVPRAALLGGDGADGAEGAGGSDGGSAGLGDGSLARRIPPAAAPQAAAAASAAAASAAAATAAAALAAPSSAAAAAPPKTPVQETAIERRARVLKAHVSASTSDADDEAGGSSCLEDLIVRLDDCVSKKAFYSADSSSSNSVHFYVFHVAQALPAKSAAPEARNKVAAVLNMFPKVVVKALLDNPTYEVLPKFAELFPKMDEKGCFIPEVRAGLEKMATYTVTSKEALSLEGISLKARMRIIGSELYRDFESSRAKALLVKAQGEVGKDRQDTLQVLQSACGNLDEGFCREVADRLTLFSTSVSLENRIAWVLQKPERLTLADGFVNEDALSWESLKVFVEAPPIWPEALTADAFGKVVGLFPVCFRPPSDTPSRQPLCARSREGCEPGHPRRRAAPRQEPHGCQRLGRHHEYDEIVREPDQLGKRGDTEHCRLRARVA